MLNSVNNSSPSFGAAVSYLGVVDHDGRELDPMTVKSIARGGSKSVEVFVDFLSQLQGKRGKDILDKLPDKDLVEISCKLPNSQSNKLVAACSLIHEGVRVPLSSNEIQCDNDLLNNFENWVNARVAYVQTLDKSNSMLEALMTKFTSNISME